MKCEVIKNVEGTTPVPPENKKGSTVVEWLVNSLFAPLIRHHILFGLEHTAYLKWFILRRNTLGGGGGAPIWKGWGCLLEIWNSTPFIWKLPCPPSPGRNTGWSQHWNISKELNWNVLAADKKGRSIIIKSYWEGMLSFIRATFLRKKKGFSLYIFKVSTRIEFIDYV